MFVVIRALIIVITIGILEQMTVFWSRPAQSQPTPWIPVFEGLPSGPAPAMHMNVEGLLVAGTLGRWGMAMDCNNR